MTTNTKQTKEVQLLLDLDFRPLATEHFQIGQRIWTLHIENADIQAIWQNWQQPDDSDACDRLGHCLAHLESAVRRLRRDYTELTIQNPLLVD